MPGFVAPSFAWARSGSSLILPTRPSSILREWTAEHVPGDPSRHAAVDAVTDDRVGIASSGAVRTSARYHARYSKARPRSTIRAAPQPSWGHASRSEPSGRRRGCFVRSPKYGLIGRVPATGYV